MKLPTTALCATALLTLAGLATPGFANESSLKEGAREVGKAVGEAAKEGAEAVKEGAQEAKKAMKSEK